MSTTAAGVFFCFAVGVLLFTIFTYRRRKEVNPDVLEVLEELESAAANLVHSRRNLSDDDSRAATMVSIEETVFVLRVALEIPNMRRALLRKGER